MHDRGGSLGFPWAPWVQAGESVGGFAVIITDSLRGPVLLLIYGWIIYIELAMAHCITIT